MGIIVIVSQGVTISPEQALFDAGFDSVTAEEFIGRLREHLSSRGWVTGTEEAEAVLSSTTVFDCPTARQMAEHIENVLIRGGRKGTEETRLFSSTNYMPMPCLMSFPPKETNYSDVL